MDGEEKGDNFFGDKVTRRVKLSLYPLNAEVQIALSYPYALYTPP
jgi:hypothetical protein